MSQGIDASDPVLRHLFKKIHEQEEKITKLQLKATLDQQYLSSKISTLENKMKTSYSRQKELEKTVQNLVKSIAELEFKTPTTDEKSIYSGRFSEMGTEKSNKPEPDYVIKNTTIRGQGPIALGSRQKRDLRSRSYPGSCCRRASYIVLKNDIVWSNSVILITCEFLFCLGFIFLQIVRLHFTPILVTE